MRDLIEEKLKSQDVNHFYVRTKQGDEYRFQKGVVKDNDLKMTDIMEHHFGTILNIRKNPKYIPIDGNIIEFEEYKADR